MTMMKDCSNSGKFYVELMNIAKKRGDFNFGRRSCINKNQGVHVHQNMVEIHEGRKCCIIQKTLGGAAVSWDERYVKDPVLELF